MWLWSRPAASEGPRYSSSWHSKWLSRDAQARFAATELVSSSVAPSIRLRRLSGSALEAIGTKGCVVVGAAAAERH